MKALRSDPKELKIRRTPASWFTKQAESHLLSNSDVEHFVLKLGGKISITAIHWPMGQIATHEKLKDLDTLFNYFTRTYGQIIVKSYPPLATRPFGALHWRVTINNFSNHGPNLPRLLWLVAIKNEEKRRELELKKG